MQYTQTVTSDFSQVSSRFSVVGKKEDKFHILSLNKVNESGSDYKYQLDDNQNNYGFDGSLEIEILETSNNKQRISVKSTNTAILESVYDVVNNKISPIKHRVIASMGYPVIFFMVFLVSLILTPFISWLVYIIWQKQDKKT